MLSIFCIIFVIFKNENRHEEAVRPNIADKIKKISFICTYPARHNAIETNFKIIISFSGCIMEYDERFDRL